MKINATNLKKGNFIEHNGQVWMVLKKDHNFRGRGSATLKAKMKSLQSASTLELTFKGDEMVEALDVETAKMQYLYKDIEGLYFMNTITFEQIHIPNSASSDMGNYLKEGDQVQVLINDGKPLTLRPPQTVTLKVTAAEDAVKGDTATSTRKTVTVETGLKVLVPLFIKTGDLIVVNTETGEYTEKG